MPNERKQHTTNQSNNRSSASGSTSTPYQNNTHQPKPNQKKGLPHSSKSGNSHQITQDDTTNPTKSNTSTNISNASTFKSKSKRNLPQLENQNQNQNHVIKKTHKVTESEETPTTSTFKPAQEIYTRSGTSLHNFEPPVLENVFKNSIFFNTKSKSTPNIKYKSPSEYNFQQHTSTNFNNIKTFSSESKLGSVYQTGFTDPFSIPIINISQRYSCSSIATAYYSDDDQDREASESQREEQEQERGGGSSQTSTRKIHRRPKRAVSRIRRKEKQKTSTCSSHEFDRQKEIQIMEKEVREELAKLDKGKEDISLIPGVRELQRVEKAIKDGHVFELRGGVMNGSAVRDTFLKRGWVQKKELSKQLSKQLSTVSQTSQNKNGTVNSKTVTSGSIDSNCWSLAQRLLSRHPPNVVWAAWVGAVSWSTVYGWQIINHQRGESFTLKKNLIRPIQKLHWYGSEPQTCTSAFLRTYRLYDDDEKLAFVQDYRLTCCISLLKWFVVCMDDKNGASKNHILSLTLTNEPNIDTATLLSLLDFALQVVKQYIRVRRHEDIDNDGDDDEEGREPSSTLTTDWPSFFAQVQKIIRRNIKFLDVSTTSTMSTATSMSASASSSAGKEGEERESRREPQNVQGVYLVAKASLKDLKPFWPHLNIDGFFNVWIFKPGCGMRGHGISVHDKYKTIAHKFLTKDTTKTTWLAQKYIERPLLIFKTKFDIRQWILITSCNPLVVWIYKQCYIRFSGKLFTLDDLNESIHLTNQAVQFRYKTDPARDPALPSNNMWTLETFQGYLKKINKPNIWKKVIYPQMKKIIMTVLLATRESIENRPTSFHLQGADFMLSDDFRPWLIEINPNPMFASTTSVTARLCQQCIRDTIKVVLDWKGDGTSVPKNPKKVDTGDWELLFHSKVPLATPIIKMDGSEETLIQCTKVATIDSPSVQEPEEFEHEGHKISRKTTRHFIPWTTTSENDMDNLEGNIDADDEEIMHLT